MFIVGMHHKRADFANLGNNIDLNIKLGPVIADLAQFLLNTYGAA